MDRSRFILLRDPTELPWWKLIVLKFAAWLIPEIKVYARLHKEVYFRSEYMRDIHEMYARERAQLNRAITKKGKQVRQLQKDLDACIAERQGTFADGVREGINRSVKIAFEEFYQRTVPSLVVALKKKASE